MEESEREENESEIRKLFRKHKLKHWGEGRTATLSIPPTNKGGSTKHA